MRILLVSQMYPGPADPDLGVFVRGLEEALAARGHVIERAVLDSRRAGKLKYLCTVPGHATAGMKGVLKVT